MRGKQGTVMSLNLHYKVPITPAVVSSLALSCLDHVLFMRHQLPMDLRRFTAAMEAEESAARHTAKRRWDLHSHRPAGLCKRYPCTMHMGTKLATIILLVTLCIH